MLTRPTSAAHQRVLVVATDYGPAARYEFTDLGQGIRVTADDTPSVVCAGDTVLGQGGPVTSGQPR